MELKSIGAKCLGFLGKYKYVVIILAVGLLFMTLPDSSKPTDKTQQAGETIIRTDTPVEEQLKSILSKMDGAGKVEVLLTVAQGKETLYQTDSKISASDQSETTQFDTVITSDAQRNQTGLIRQENPPIYQGAVILCQGADSAAVRFSIVDAVSKATGLGADQICVLKMK